MEQFFAFFGELLPFPVFPAVVHQHQGTSGPQQFEPAEPASVLEFSGSL